MERVSNHYPKKHYGEGKNEGKKLKKTTEGEKSTAFKLNRHVGSSKSQQGTKRKLYKNMCIRKDHGGKS